MFYCQSNYYLLESFRLSCGTTLIGLFPSLTRTDKVQFASITKTVLAVQAGNIGKLGHLQCALDILYRQAAYKQLICRDR